MPALNEVAGLYRRASGADPVPARVRFSPFQETTRGLDFYADLGSGLDFYPVIASQLDRWAGDNRPFVGLARNFVYLVSAVDLDATAEALDGTKATVRVTAFRLADGTDVTVTGSATFQARTGFLDILFDQGGIAIAPDVSGVSAPLAGVFFDVAREVDGAFKSILGTVPGFTRRDIWVAIESQASDFQNFVVTTDDEVEALQKNTLTLRTKFAPDLEAGIDYVEYGLDDDGQPIQWAITGTSRIDLDEIILSLENER